MDRFQLLDMVTRARREADDCERRMLAQRDLVRSLRSAGQDTDAADKALTELELAYDRLIAEMQNLLDELDRQAEASATGQSQSDPQQTSSP